MASRWMQGMRSKAAAERKRRGNCSLTSREKHFYTRQAFLGESVDAHLERMLAEAAQERSTPTEWWRYLARVLVSVPAPFDNIERYLITKYLNEDENVHQAQVAVLRYRRLTR